MKKMTFLGLGLIVVCLSVVGCAKNTEDYVFDNLSEYTQIYYYGENENFYSTLSIGKRESDYLMNGKSENCVDFSLLCVHLEQSISSQTIVVTLNINGEESQKELELNTLNDIYMIDLEISLTADDNIEVEYNNSQIKLNPLSSNFSIDYKKAIKIASKELEDQILLKKSFSNLNAECYLRILDKKANNFDGMFWCFTVLNVSNESYSVIISTEDGSILAKSN